MEKKLEEDKDTVKKLEEDKKEKKDRINRFLRSGNKLQVLLLILSFIYVYVFCTLKLFHRMHEF